MGAWGTGLFSDDTASDVRGDYNELLQTGIVTDEEAEQLMFKEYKEVIDNEDEESAIFWFAMAKLESDKGRLSERVKKEALKYLDSGIDLERWEESDKKSLKKRKAVLEELRTQINGPQPERKKIKTKKIHKCPYKPGDILAYKLSSYESIKGYLRGVQIEDNIQSFCKEHDGYYVVLEVLSIYQEKPARLLESDNYDETAFEFTVFNYFDDHIPSKEELQKMKYMYPRAFEQWPYDYWKESLPLKSKTIEERTMEIYDLARHNVINHFMSSSIEWTHINSGEQKMFILGKSDDYPKALPPYFAYDPQRRPIHQEYLEFEAEIVWPLMTWLYSDI